MPAYAKPFLDSLLDSDADSPGLLLSREEYFVSLKESIRRHLEWVLNTSPMIGDIPSHLVNLKTSVYAYGTPPLDSFEATSEKDRARLSRTFEHIIQTFEPRLRLVTISLSESHGNSILEFRIDAYLVASASTIPVSFDTRVKTDGRYDVRGA